MAGSALYGRTVNDPHIFLIFQMVEEMGGL